MYNTVYYTWYWIIHCIIDLDLLGSGARAAPRGSWVRWLRSWPNWLVHGTKVQCTYKSTVRTQVHGVFSVYYATLTVPVPRYLGRNCTPPAPASLAHNCTVACTLLHTLARPSLPVGCKPTASHTSLGYKPYTTPMGGNGCLGVFSGTTNHPTMRLPLELLTASPSGPAQLHKSPSTGPLPGTVSFFLLSAWCFFPPSSHLLPTLIHLKLKTWSLMKR